MMPKLTKPQLTMLTRAFRGTAAPLSGAGYRVAARLTAFGYGEVRDHLFHVNYFGLVALRDHWRGRWGNNGCHAYLLNMQEAEKALLSDDYPIAPPREQVQP